MATSQQSLWEGSKKLQILNQILQGFFEIIGVGDFEKFLKQNNGTGLLKFAKCTLCKGSLGRSQNPKNPKNFARFFPRFARALSLRAPHAGFAGMWGTTTLRARFARGHSYLTVSNLPSPLNFFQPSSVPPTPFPLLCPQPLPLSWALEREADQLASQPTR